MAAATLPDSAVEESCRGFNTWVAFSINYSNIHCPSFITTNDQTIIVYATLLKT